MPVPPLNVPISWRSTNPDVVALFDDLQANILKGHGRRLTINLFLKFDSAKAAGIKETIHQLSGELKTAKQQLSEAENFKHNGRDGGTVRCLLLSFAGYKALGVAAKAPAAPAAPAASAFHDGMQTRVVRLADPPVANWEANFQQQIDGMLLLADNDPERLELERDSVAASLEAVGVTVLFEERGDQQFNDRGQGVEHFGYVDGRSQPIFLTEDIEHEKLINGGTSMWDPAFPLEQVLVTTGSGSATAVLGSFFVFRKLEQNVFGFKRKEEELSTLLGFHGEERELAGALMVGRFEDGTPVVLRKEAGFGGGVPNNFNYDDDKVASKCPFHAHIRKTNPRGSGGAEPQAGERKHIMARRGITFGSREDGMGDRPEDGVGLLFMSHQSSIENQFEFTQATWANNPGFPLGAPTPPGIDPVMGQGANVAGTQQTPKVWGDPASAKVPADFSGFVTMKGGEYFFAPVISTLRTL